MYWVIGTPIAGLMEALTAWLTGMSQGNKILLGVICGLMTAFDMGGPVNKVSYCLLYTSWPSPRGKEEPLP